jgi:hypothetical protein
MVLACWIALSTSFCLRSTPPEGKSSKEGPLAPSVEPTVRRLIEQLGSAEFTEREAATKGLAKIGLPALEALKKAARSDDPEVARRANDLLRTVGNRLEDLLVSYRAYGLPLPPGDAPLVRFEGCRRGMVNSKRIPPPDALGFLVGPATKDAGPLVLVGTQEYRLGRHDRLEIIKPDPDAARDIDFGSVQDDTAGWQNLGLFLALQCQARGWDDLAQTVWTTNKEEFGQRPDRSNRTVFAEAVWRSFCLELIKPATNRRNIAGKMKQLLEAESCLHSLENHCLLRSLEAALVASTARPGSIERLIDDLTEACNNAWGPDDFDAATTKLGRKGFVAVPTLLEHFDDDRLTRRMELGCIDPSQFLRVKHLVRSLLHELLGPDFRGTWGETGEGLHLTKEAVRKWWQEAQKAGEEKYLLAHVLPAGPDSKKVNRLAVMILADKYPHHLRALYRAALEAPDRIESWPIAEAIARSSLPAAEKRRLFLQASTHRNLYERWEGLIHLRQLDPEQFIRLLLASLETLPRTPTAPYWLCQEGHVTRVVMATDDPRAWQALVKYAKRADVGLRMELMHHMSYILLGDRHRKQRLEFLAAFLDDREVRDKATDRKMFDGPFAAFGFSRLAVQNLAAMELAGMLDVLDQSESDWTARQWQELREQVKQELRR